MNIIIIVFYIIFEKTNVEDGKIFLAAD